MRRVFQSNAQKRRSKRRAKYELKRRRWVKRERTTPLKAPIRAVTPSARQQFKPLPAPNNFSLVDNPDEALQYFKTAQDWIRGRRRIMFDLQNTDRLTPDAIALLVAKVHDRAFTKGTPTTGNEPLNPDAARIFAESGFYEHVQPQVFRPRNPKNLLLHQITFNKVENEQARDAGRLAVAHLYKDGRRIRPLYEVLVECMANTNNHADIKRRGVYDWWLFVYNDPNEPRTVFTFLDLGVGVFRSLPVQNFWRDPLRSVGLRGNLSIVRKLLAGEISSRTGKQERGKGIPRINEHAISGTFSRFIVITNDVYADLLKQSFRYLKEPFHGTLYCFEITALGQP